MSRTPLASRLRQEAAFLAEAAKAGRPLEEVSGPWHERRMDRREFIGRATRMGAAAAATLAVPLPRAAPPSARHDEGRPRVLVVGAGLAGMTAAYRLWQAGLSPLVHEASARIGGRTWTLRGFAGGQISEHGGEFINSDHVALIGLCRELGLGLDDLYDVHYPGPVHAVNSFHGAVYPWWKAVRDFQDVYPAVQRDLRAAGYPTFWNRFTEDGRRLDNMSVAEWIEQNIPGGLCSNFGHLVSLAYVDEYGLDVGDQSALNLLYELGYSPRQPLLLNGPQDFRYHVTGGNDLVVAGMADRLPSTTTVLRSALVALRRNADDTITCTFDADGSIRDEVADGVILTLPFTTLRRVDLSRARFSRLMMRAINEYGMGTNAKLHLQFNDRVWYRSQLDGDTFSDTGYQETWETDIGSPATSGLLVNYTGGSVGAGYGDAAPHGRASEHVARRTLRQMEPVIPGIEAAWNGSAYLDYWAADPWHLGSYACYRVGQYTAFGGYSKVAQGNVHFAGEHTSYDFQGFMTGAVASGERAAREVLQSLGVRVAPVSGKRSTRT